MAHLFNVVVYDSFNRKNVKISTTYYFLDFSFFMSQDDALYQNHLNAPKTVFFLLLPPSPSVLDVLSSCGRRAFDGLKTPEDSFVGFFIGLVICKPYFYKGNSPEGRPYQLQFSGAQRLDDWFPPQPFAACLAAWRLEWK